MGERVFICREANERSWWSGIGEGDAPGGNYRLSPSFASVLDAIAWWQERGNDFILVRLDDSEYRWAGDGPVPVDGTGNPVARRLFEALAEEPPIGATHFRHVADQTTSTAGKDWATTLANAERPVVSLERRWPGGWGSTRRGWKQSRRDQCPVSTCPRSFVSSAQPVPAGRIDIRARCALRVGCNEVH